MVALLDIAPVSRSVDVNGQSVTVHGVSARGIAAILARFPALREAIGRQDTSKLTAEFLMEMVPDAIADIIARGCGYDGDDNAKAIEFVQKLPAQVQVDLLRAVLELTMPKGVGPFVEGLLEVMSGLDARARVSASPSQQPSKS